MSADIEPPAGWRKVMGPLKSPSIHISSDIATLIAGEWEFTGFWGSEPRPYAIRIGSGIDKENPPDYPAEWQGEKVWVRVENPQPVIGWQPIHTVPETPKRSMLVHCSKNHNTYTAYHEAGIWFHFAAGLGKLTETPTHWMPIPPPPELDVEKPQPTTVRGWLEALPDGYRERALGQYDETQNLSGSLPNSIHVFAVWSNTAEGHGFWCKVGSWALGRGDLPPLPADPPESAVVTPPETTHDDLAERIAIAIAPDIIAEWSYNNEDLPTEIAKLAKAIAGELRK